MARSTLIAFVLVGGFARAQPRAVVEARLGAGEAGVRAVVDRAAADGLPAQLLVDKAREGSAKGASAARIALAVRGLADRLAGARDEAETAGVATPPPALLQAIVEAHAAGVGRTDVATVLRGGGDRTRAVEVLTDLAARGYPAGVAARTVAAIAGRDAHALDRLVDDAERLRAIDAATPDDALDALARAAQQGIGIDHAEQLLRRGSDPLDGDLHGPNRETSGNRGPRSGGVAAPTRGKS